MGDFGPLPTVLINRPTGAPKKLGRPPLPPGEANKRAARRKLWARGNLSWKFEKGPWAKQLYEWIRANFGCSGFLFAMVHRRGWKSSTALIVALEECLRKANTSVAIITSTKEQAEAICDESFVELIRDCPPHLQPRKIKNSYEYVFDHNGSKIKVLPADGGNWRKIRGRKFRLIIISEACFIEAISEIIKIALPCLRSVTGETTGTMLLESTPPDTPSHPSERLWAEAEIDGHTFFMPLSKNTWASPVFVEQVQKDSGGKESIDYRREFELEFVFDDDTTALPEFTKARAFDGTPAGEDGTPAVLPLVREVARPNNADRYGALDIGGSDFFGHLWGFYLFEQDLLVIEDEELLVDLTSAELAEEVKDHEEALWGATPAGKLRRFADNNNVILLYDLRKMHSLAYVASAKDNRQAQINRLRVMIKEGRIVIHPRCTRLIKTMRLARKAAQARKGFLPIEGLGHCDLLEALLFLVRNLSRRDLPTGDSTPVPQATQGFRRPGVDHSRGERALAHALGMRRRF